MQLTRQNALDFREIPLAKLQLGVKAPAESRYLSDLRIPRKGSFARDTEWIGELPESLSKNQG